MMQNPIKNKKTLIFSFFGIALGLCIGTVLKNYRALEIVKRCNIKNGNQKSPFEIIRLSQEDTIQNSQKTLVFVGIMTAKNFIGERAKAVYDTWGKEVPGHIAFFSSEGSFSTELPVISLKNVDDRYPPQKKSFMMLYYMYEHYIDKFEWFIRADDDVYIEPTKLERFLRSIDSSKPQFIGQAGKGNAEEFGQLLLEFDENFCMGGPGVILSRETLRRVAPHIPTCIKNLYSTHEDVEVGRCVQKFAGIPCTWNYEMQYILRHNSSGKYAFTGKLKRKEINNAISLHPIKKGFLMYRLHSYIQGLKADELRQDTLLLHRDIKHMVNLLKIPEYNKYLAPGIPLISAHNVSHRSEEQRTKGVIPDLKKFVPTRSQEILNWTFIARNQYSIANANPKQKIDSALRESLEEVITEVMENINNFSRQRGRVIEFRELLYGYQRQNPIYGHDIILDLLLIYKKYRGKKMTVPVRRHMYVQREFSGTFVKEADEDAYKSNHQKNLIQDILSKGISNLSNRFTISKKVSGTKQTESNTGKTKIIFVLPISGRLTTFTRFLENFEQVANQETVDLLVILCGSSDETYQHKKLVLDLIQKSPLQQINFIELSGKFSRGMALDTAIRSSFIKDDDIILFIDVDMIFSIKTIDRIRMNTIQGRQVYLPIVFSQYVPQHREWTRKCISNDSGYFRQFGFGICSIFKSDILDRNVNGFDKGITGWGLEDVRFLEKLVNVAHHQPSVMQNTAEVTFDSGNNEKKNIQLVIFRAPDPSLIHIYHDITCDLNLEASQYNMCLGTKANSVGSTTLLESIFFQSPNYMNFIDDFNKNRIYK